MSKQEGEGSNLGPRKPYFEQGPVNLGSTTISTHGSISHRRQIRRAMSTAYDPSEDAEDKGSMASAYTYRSDIDAFRLLREADGRLFNTLNETYSWPADESEWTRLNKLHIAFILGFGGLHPAKATVDAVLAPQEGEQKRILDLGKRDGGTGTGIWAIDMAKRFPHCAVFGVDIAPGPTDLANVPPKCQFEIDDIQLGLAHFHQPSNQFDLIHVRTVAMGLTNFRKTLNDIACCLKPGGLLIWIERDYDTGFTSDVLIPRELGSEANPNGTWTGRFVFETMKALSTSHKSDYAGMADGLDRGFWNQPLMDPESCRAASLYLPLVQMIDVLTLSHTVTIMMVLLQSPSASNRLWGPFLITEIEIHWYSHEPRYSSQSFLPPVRKIEWLNAIVTPSLCFDSRPQELYGGMKMILTKTGWPLDTIAEWQRRSEEELASVGPPMLTRFRVAWGRRNDQLDLPPKFSSILSPGISSSTLTANPTTFSTSTPSQVPRAQDETNQEEEAVTDPFSEASPYPFFYIYETEQQALKEYDFRKGSKEVFSFPASPLSS